MLSLGRAAAAKAPEMQLEQAVADLLENDARFLSALGPQHVIKDSAEEIIPLEVWTPVLAAIVRYFPGLGPFSICADLAAAPTEAPHTIFMEPLAQLDLLLLRLRSLCFSSWRENNEVAALLSRYLGEPA
jgi:hypothetical protein